jgi:glycosyltransferase involved in cell wall biosynthesis
MAGGATPKVVAIGLESRSFRDGGLNRYFSELVAALGQLGTPIVGLVTGQPGSDELVEVVAPAEAPLLTRFRAFVSAVRRHSDTDIVDAHFALTALPLLFTRVRHLPFVFHFQGPWADESVSVGERRFVCALKRYLERILYRRAGTLVVLSRAFRRILIERYGVSPWNIHVIPPGVDTDRFSPGDRSEARKALGLPLDAFIAVAVRRLVPRMGLDVLLEAWAKLVSNDETHLILCIVGTGPQRAELEQHCTELGLKGLVRFAGRVDDENLVRYYRASDVSIVPSVALEGFGLVVLESVSTGTPVVASELGGLSEALSGLAPDMLVPPGDPEALACRVRGAVTGIEPLPTRETCRRYAEKFAWSEVARRHVELYERAVSGLLEEDAVEQRKLRVVVLGHSAQLSGAELAIQRAIPALTEVRIHAILAEDGPLVSLLESAGASVEVLLMDDRLRDLRKDRVAAMMPMPAFVQSAVYVFRLAIRLRQIRPDLVHTNTLKAALYGGSAARLARIPCVWHVRDRIADDYLPIAGVKIVRAAARILPSAIIANSQATLASLHLPERSSRTVAADALRVVIPSPVIKPQGGRASRSNASAGLRIAMVGRLASWKGQDVFLRAFAKAFPNGEEVAVLVGAALFGEDAFERKLHKLAGHLGIETRVEFKGFRADVFEELAHVDVLVHASIIPEPFGQVVLQGMAAGLPVVASGAGGPAEIISDGYTGLLYPPGDVDALSTLLIRLDSDAGMRRRLGDQARRAVASYSPECVAEQMMDVYKATLRRSGTKCSHQGASNTVRRPFQGHRRVRSSS